MKIKNLTRDKIVAEDVKFLKGFDAFKGLMFRKPLKQKEALLLAAPYQGRVEAAIHTFFVFFKIDVVWLDDEFRVVDIAENVPPFCPIKKPSVPAKYVLELCAGAVGRVELKLGDQLRLLE